MLAVLGVVLVQLVVLGAVAFALGWHVSPPGLAPAGLLILVDWLALKGSRRRVVFGALMQAAVALLVLLPWAARNYIVLGKPILFRSNFGLELAIRRRAYGWQAAHGVNLAGGVDLAVVEEVLGGCFFLEVAAPAGPGRRVVVNEFAEVADEGRVGV